MMINIYTTLYDANIYDSSDCLQHASSDVFLGQSSFVLATWLFRLGFSYL